MGRPVVHFEFLSKDAKKTAMFYQKLFGWKTSHLPELDYTIVDTATKGLGVNGGIDAIKGKAKPQTVIYVDVPNVQKALDTAVSMGAKIVTPVTKVPGMVVLAVFRDPQGIDVGLVKDISKQKQ